MPLLHLVIDEISTLDASEEGQPQWSKPNRPTGSLDGTWSTSFPISFGTVYTLVHGLHTSTLSKYYINSFQASSISVSSITFKFGYSETCTFGIIAVGK